MQGYCKLYDSYGDLRESHIHPKFAIKYFKKTGSKYLRNFATPNVRVQDGEKRYLLSEKAEQDFSAREKWFFENIFIEFMENNKRSFEYNENLFYFSISFLWRVLLTHLDHPNVIDKPYAKTLHEVSDEWKCFLRDSKFPLTYHNCYLFLTERGKFHELDIKGFNYYMTRTLDGTIVSNHDSSYVAIYGKFLRFIFWAVIIDKKNGDQPYLKINPIGGQIVIPQAVVKDAMTDFFSNRVRQCEQLQAPSQAQQELILKEVLKDKEAFLKSDAWQSLKNDNQI